MSEFRHDLVRPGPSETWSGPEAEDLYEFQPLRTRTTIRVIEICPEKVQGCIACQIFQIDKEEKNKPYRALSYVWGDPQATRQIFLKGGQDDRWRRFPLHENLWQFLNLAWEQRQFGMLFWTDRLCLNQEDPKEISQQVPRMRPIYRNAQCVLIFLNLREKEERYLPEMMQLYDSLCALPKRIPVGKIKERYASVDQDIILGLINNPYWTRVWIMQEVVVSRDVYVTYQHGLIPLGDLAHMLFHSRRSSSRSYEKLWVLELYLMHHGLKCRSLSNILIDLSDYQSSRPADRVYGFMGLVENNPDGSWPTDNIQVDYEKPTPHIFLDAMFESVPRPTEYKRLPECLGGWGTYDSHALLEGYIGDSKTTQRHKNLAVVALQTLEAFNIIKSVPGAPDQKTMISIAEDITGHPPYGASNYKMTLHAAAIGIALARSSSGPLDRWRACWARSGGDGSCPWRCAAHGPVDIALTAISSRLVSSLFRRRPKPSSKRIESYGPVIGKTWRGSWDRERVVEACGKPSRTRCDGSVMSCEIPRAGLRFLLAHPSDELERSLILQWKGWDDFARYRTGRGGSERDKQLMQQRAQNEQ